MSWFQEAQKLREQGLTYREIAEICEKSYQTVKNRFCQERKRAKKNNIVFEDRKEFSEEDFEEYIKQMKAFQKLQKSWTTSKL